MQLDDGGAVVPAMPSDLFAHQALVLQAIDEIYNEGKECYDKSLVKRYDVVNVPLKVDTKRFPSLAETLNSAKNTTKHINPYKLIKHNIGCNRDYDQNNY